jgi:hypothetical protein
MKSVVLVPYCPFPIDTGGKAEMWKHLNILKQLGDCRIVTARRRPVGMGWSPQYEQKFRSLGFDLVFREDACGFRWQQVLSYVYGFVCKGFGLERAFGHSNPYHRFAFPKAWWYEQTKHADVAVINYSYWAWLPCNCSKVVVLLDLWSNFMWEGARRETTDLSAADLVVVISRDEEDLLNQRNIMKTLWSPPVVPSADLPLTSGTGLVGSGNRFNIEGLRWLENGLSGSCISIKVFGDLSRHVRSQAFIAVGRYQSTLQPFRDCGIILMPTSGGMGMQIKAVEALAAGRAIIARKGAMRGLPPGHGAWIEVERPEEMVSWAQRLQSDNKTRSSLAKAAQEYYLRHLDAATTEQRLEKAYVSLAETFTGNPVCSNRLKSVSS